MVQIEGFQGGVKNYFIIFDRKRLKKRKRHSSDHEPKSKHKKVVLPLETSNSQFCATSSYIPSPNTSLYATDCQIGTQSFVNSVLEQSRHSLPTECNSVIAAEPSQINSADKSVSLEKSRAENVLTTPEKRLSSSRRKAATPKKLTSDIQGSFVQTLTDNINAKVMDFLAEGWP